jgi:hypothetical protein
MSAPGIPEPACPLRSSGPFIQAIIGRLRERPTFLSANGAIACKGGDLGCEKTVKEG